MSNKKMKEIRKLIKEQTGLDYKEVRNLYRKAKKVWQKTK